MSLVTLQIKQANEDDVLALDWSADGTYIATGDSKGRLQVYDLRNIGEGTAEPVFTFEQSPEDPKAVLTVSWNPLKPVRSTPCDQAFNLLYAENVRVRLR